MNVCFAVLHYDSTVAGTDPTAYLDRVPIHRHLPAQVARFGHNVRVVHLYPTDHAIEIDGVRHEFVSPGRIARAVSASATSRSHRDRAVFEPAWRAVQRICSPRPDVVHFHGTNLTWNLALLLLRLDRGIPVVAHYHGGFPARHPIARAIQRKCFERVDALLFTTREQSLSFVVESDLNPQKVVEFVETSSDFVHGARDVARLKTGMLGDPVFVWTGRLESIKDPLTALRGFERIAEAWPGARLYLNYLTDQLLPDARTFVASRPKLVGRVHFRGRAAPSEMQDIYNSADFFLQCSIREVAGYAVLEAMACGVIPVITDIPSFRAMTALGTYGILFPAGDPDALAARTLAVPRAEIATFSQSIRDHFERALSFPALAGQLDGIYRALATEN